jgi:hypothetical protein
MTEDKNKKIKKSETSTSFANTAGSVAAKSWAYATTGLQIIQDLDAIAAQLANIDFSKTPGCKSVSGDEKSALDIVGEEFTDFSGIIATCSPLVNVKPGEPLAEQITDGILSAIELILSAENRFPACAEQQFRKFLSVIPVQYYLLTLLAKTAQQLPGEIKKFEIETPCGTSIEEIETFADRIPNFDLPLLPELPYIRIPDLSDIIDKILYEILCVAICAATTPIIRSVGRILFDTQSSWNELLFGENPDDAEIQPLIKISINPYLSDQAFESAKARGLIPKDISNEKIRNYISSIQEREDIGQEEFVFLFLGKSNCRIVNKILDIPSTTAVFKLTDDQKILDFFSYLGSFVNFLDLINESKANVCYPDPCDITDAEVNEVISSINDLCGLLNPELGLPSLPLAALMSSTGANEIIGKGTYDSYVAVANGNGSVNAYNFPQTKDKDGFQRVAVVTYIVPYIQTFLPWASEQINYTLPNKPDVEQRNIAFQKSVNFISYIFPFIVNDITRDVEGKDVKYNDVQDFYPMGITVTKKDILPPAAKGEIGDRLSERNGYTIQHYVKYPERLIEDQMKVLQADAKAAQGNENQDDLKAFMSLKGEFGL